MKIFWSYLQSVNVKQSNAIGKYVTLVICVLIDSQQPPHQLLVQYLSHTQSQAKYNLKFASD